MDRDLVELRSQAAGGGKAMEIRQEAGLLPPLSLVKASEGLKRPSYRRAPVNTMTHALGRQTG